MMLGNEQGRNMKEKRRCAMKMPPPAPSEEGAVIKYVCGIDICDLTIDLSSPVTDILSNSWLYKPFENRA
jgi:hypothetical protein